MNSFSHDDFNAPGRMDQKVQEFFERIMSDLGNTIVLFFSDHGYHKDFVPNNILGWFESRQPFLFVGLPEKFEETYPKMYKNLKANVDKLISPFDMYETTQQILQMSGTNHHRKKGKSCNTSMSLFEEIPAVRSCEDACIPTYWCTCLQLNFATPLSQNETLSFFVDI